MTKRRPDNGPFKEFVFGDWFFDELNRAGTEFKEKKWRKEPPEFSGFRKHMRNAVKEQLLAVRELLDTVIDEVDPEKLRRA